MKIKRIASTLILCAVIICSSSATAQSSDTPVFVIEDQITEYMDLYGIRDFFSGSGEMADGNTVHDVIAHLTVQGG